MFSKEKLEALAYLGSRNKDTEFEFEGKYFNTVEEEWFTYDKEYYGASLYAIKNIDNKRASVYVVIDNSKGNEGCDLTITSSFKEALKTYKDFKELIKLGWSTDEAVKRKQLWFESLDAYTLESSLFSAYRIAYDSNIKQFIFLTFDNYENAGFSYGIDGDLLQSNVEMFDSEGSEIPYEYGFEKITGVIEYLKDNGFDLEDWKEKGLKEFALSSTELQGCL